ncbi:hypothetical protein KIPB_003750 [Kipferlia bialata]|uniref:GP-PDE domain-containing protein n=1 Tax=Kipferlia bialata TaxID=797122 RepID=A0A9K3GH95_9EUKA|nr:hypothetical protein KIPB_003750 [Kipferlia bialata]|eukprot:g3750.t1
MESDTSLPVCVSLDLDPSDDVPLVHTCPSPKELVPVAVSPPFTHAQAVSPLPFASFPHLFLIPSASDTQGGDDITMSLWAHPNQAEGECPPQLVGVGSLSLASEHHHDGESECRLVVPTSGRVSATVCYTGIVTSQPEDFTPLLTPHHNSRLSASFTSFMRLGHRGCGSNKRHGLGQHVVPFCENTVESSREARSAGMDGIEFDVVLGADDVCVINHDFEVEVRQGSFTYNLPIPVLDSPTFLALRSSRAMRDRRLKKEKERAQEASLIEGRARASSCLSLTDMGRDAEAAVRQMQAQAAQAQAPTEGSFSKEGSEGEDESHRYNVLFSQRATLKDMLTKCDRQCRMNVEVKYPTGFWARGSKRVLYPRRDKVVSTTLDTVLHSTLLKHKHLRTVFFSAFDPDLCLILRVRQTKYPVFLLHCGGSFFNEWPDVQPDPRCACPWLGLAFAARANLPGMVLSVKTLAEVGDEFVPKAAALGIRILTYGSLSDDIEHIAAQHGHGVAGVIVDLALRTAQ